MNATDIRMFMDLSLRDDLDAFIHRSFLTLCPSELYLHSWYIEAIAWELKRCATGENTRLLITLPPRCLKSICASVSFPAWLLGRDPTARIMAASYSAPLAAKFSRDSRTLLNADWYRRAFPRTRLSSAKSAEMEFATTRGGYRCATSVGGTVTGRGGSYFIIDDPINASDARSAAARERVNDWIDSTAYSRLDDKRTGVIIVAMQRFHLDDPVGHLLEKDEKWRHLDLPAIAPREQRIQIGPDRYVTRKVGDILHAKRESSSDLELRREQMGNYNFSAQYLQQPVPLEGEIVKVEWFKEYDEAPERGPDDKVVLSIDTASKATEISDFSVCTVWHVRDDQYYLIGLHREKLQYPALRDRVLTLAKKYEANAVIIEDSGTGSSLLQEIGPSLARENRQVIEYRPTADKVTRMQKQTGVIESGRVHLPATAEWRQTLLSELLQFPQGRHDDQVDSLSQFLDWAEAGRNIDCTVHWV